MARTIDVRKLDDNLPSGNILSNVDYNRWGDGLFIGSLVISILTVFIVMGLIIMYLCKSRSYKADPLPRGVFAINDYQNWTLTLLM